MFKKSLFICALILCLGGTNAAATIITNKANNFSEQNRTIFTATAQQHGYVTEQDINNFISIGRDLEKAFKKDDRVEAAKIMQTVNWKYNEGCYVILKLKYGYWLLKDTHGYFAERLESMNTPPALIPSADEFKLIDKYSNKLSRFFE